MTAAMASAFSGGAMPSYRPAAMKVGHVMLSSRSSASKRLRASSCAISPRRVSSSDGAARVPSELVEQCGRIGCVVGHLVRSGWDLGLAQATLVEGDDVEVLGEPVDHRPRLGQRLTAALEVEEARTTPPVLVVDVDP